MTALKEYDRLESTALWRSDQGEQRREVVAALGDLTIVITDINDRVLAHWSIDAVVRQNPGKTPASFYPRGNPGETLELRDEGMVDAINRLQDTIERSRPHPGRVRRLVTWTLFITIFGFVVFGVPQIIHQHALSVLPPVALRDTGEQLLTQTRKMTGTTCENPAAKPALKALSQRLTQDGAIPPRLSVVSEGFETTVALPGGIILINRALIENNDSAEVLAGYLIAEQARMRAHPPMQAVLDSAGLTATIKLLSRGHLPESATEDYARSLLLTTPEWPSESDMAAGFAKLKISPTSFLRAVAGQAPADYDAIQRSDDVSPVLSDAEWIRLQSICDQ